MPFQDYVYPCVYNNSDLTIQFQRSLLILWLSSTTKCMSFFNKVGFCITKSKKSGNGKKLMHFDIGGQNWFNNSDSTIQFQWSLLISWLSSTTKRMSFFNKVDFCITKSKKSGNSKKLMHFYIGGKNWFNLFWVTWNFCTPL